MNRQRGKKLLRIDNLFAMNKRHSFIFFCSLFISQISYSQSLDTITTEDLRKDSIQINNLVLNFLKCTNPKKIQQYIYFPYFSILTSCIPDHENPRPEGDNLTDEQVLSIYNNKNCHCPFYFYILKFNYQRVYRDSIRKSKISLFESYYYSDKNRRHLLKWMIKEYKFPRYPKLPLLSVKISNGTHTYPSVRIGEGYNNYNLSLPFIFTTIELALKDAPFLVILKVKNEYKICNVWYPWEKASR